MVLQKQLVNRAQGRTNVGSFLDQMIGQLVDVLHFPVEQGPWKHGCVRTLEPGQALGNSCALVGGQEAQESLLRLPWL